VDKILLLAEAPPAAGSQSPHVAVSAGGGPTSPSAPGTFLQTVGLPDRGSLLLPAQ